MRRRVLICSIFQPEINDCHLGNILVPEKGLKDKGLLRQLIRHTGYTWSRNPRDDFGAAFAEISWSTGQILEYLKKNNLDEDISESHNIASQHPEIVEDMLGLMKASHTHSAHFQFGKRKK